MKPQQNLRINASKKPNTSLVLDWAALSREIFEVLENDTITFNSTNENPKAITVNVLCDGKVIEVTSETNLTPKVTFKNNVISKCEVISEDKVTPTVHSGNNLTKQVTFEGNVTSKCDGISKDKGTPKITSRNNLTEKVTFKDNVTSKCEVISRDKVTPKMISENNLTEKVAFKDNVTSKCDEISKDSVTPKMTSGNNLTEKVTFKDNVTSKCKVIPRDNVTSKMSSENNLTANVTFKDNMISKCEVISKDKVTPKMTSENILTTKVTFKDKATSKCKAISKDKVTPRVVTKIDMTPKIISKAKVTLKNTVTSKPKVTSNYKLTLKGRVTSRAKAPSKSTVTSKPRVTSNYYKVTLKGTVTSKAKATSKNKLTFRPKAKAISKNSVSSKPKVTSNYKILTSKAKTTHKIRKTKAATKKHVNTMPENLHKALRELSEEVKSTKNCDQCDQVPEPLLGFELEDGRKSRTNIEDLKSILVDGVDIDTGSDDVSNGLSDTEEILVFESTDSNSTDSAQVMNIHESDIQYSYLKPYLDALKSKRAEIMNDSSNIDKSRKEYKIFLNNRLSAYIPTMRTKLAEKQDEPLEDREMEAYLNIFKAKYDNKSLLENKTTLSNTDISKTYSTTVTDKYAKENKTKSRVTSLNLSDIKTNHTDHDLFKDDTINKDISQHIDLKSIIKSYAAKYINNANDISKYKGLLDYFNITIDTDIHPNNSQDAHRRKEDLSDRDISLDFDTLYDYKDSNSGVQMETNKEKTIRDEANNVIDEPHGYDEESLASNFKFPLDDYEQSAKSLENKYLSGW
uniref:Uncharacterized protein n=1 Tax=Heliothis virescens TaxID=7102 RepID=A0A2A4J579_HELVI